MTEISLLSGTPETLDCDAVVVGLTGGDSPALAPGAEPIAAALPGLLEALVAAGATGKEGETVRIATFGAIGARSVLAVGLGDGLDTAPIDEIRDGAAVSIRALAGATTVATTLAGDGRPSLVRAVTEGCLLGAYSFEHYRTTPAGPAPVGAVVIATPAADAAVDQLRAGTVVADAVTFARDLVNTPPNDLVPEDLAGAAQAAATEFGLEVEVLDEQALADGGYGGICAVGQGSANPPRLAIVRHTHPEATATLALVGKGITFDSGGLSLKPSGSMTTMKSDMGGAASVLAAVTAIHRLGVPLNVTAYLACAENMPGGSALRVSDVITHLGGKTCEVTNTDAEGRLVLADAIVRAGMDGADYIVDVATLTGAQIVALGTRTAGVMAGDDEFRTRIVEASLRAGEHTWPMPLPKELAKNLESTVADMKNSGTRPGGMLFAGIYLRQFVADGISWGHIDIAGPSYNEDAPYGCTPKGATGMIVRTLIELASDLAR